MKYEVYKVEDRVTSGGNAMKSLTLQGEGKQYPEKFVALWSDHPLFNEIAAGQTIDVEIKVEDSNKPNPKAPGTFYKNRTVLKPGQSAPAPLPAGAGENARLSNAIDLKLIPLITRVEAALDRLEKVTGFLAGDESKKPVLEDFEPRFPDGSPF